MAVDALVAIRATPPPPSPQGYVVVDTLVTVIDVPQFAREMGLAEGSPSSVEDGPPPHGIPLTSVGDGPSDDPGVRPLSELLVEQVGVAAGAEE